MARQALAALRRQSMIVSRAGAGSFIAEPRAAFLHTRRLNVDAGGHMAELVHSSLDPDQFTLHLTWGK